MSDANGGAQLALLVVSLDAEVRRSAVEHFEQALGAQSVCLEAETTARAMDLAAARHPRTVLLDLRDDAWETLRVVPRLLEQSPGSRVVGLYSPLRLPQGAEPSELFLEGLRQGLFDFLRLPISPEEARRVLTRLAPAGPAQPAATRPRGRIVSFMSSKGGVGKTSLCVNAAVALTRHYPGEVAVVDGSLEAGSVSDFFNLRPEKTLYDAAAARARLDGDLLRSLMTRHEESGVWVLPCPRAVEQVAAVTDEALMQVLVASREAFKVVVVDAYPIFNAMSIAIGDLSDRIAVVTEAIVPAVNGTHELFQRLKDAGYGDDRLRLVLNAYTRFRGNVDAALVAETLRRSVNWVLPYDKTMHECANVGRPYLLQSPGTSLAVKIEAMAAELAGVAAPSPRPLWSRVLSLGRRS